MTHPDFQPGVMTINSGGPINYWVLTLYVFRNNPHPQVQIYEMIKLHCALIPSQMQRIIHVVKHHWVHNFSLTIHYINQLIIIPFEPTGLPDISSDYLLQLYEIA
jgi:hypothetical protein